MEPGATALAVTAALALALAAAARRTVWLTRVASWSMAPTLRPADLLLTRRLRRSEGPRRGDIVVIRSAELGRRVVKRVIGLPGETVEVGAGGVSVDGQPLDEPYARATGGAAGTFRVPVGSYFVLGDNRSASLDSRRWKQPFVSRGAIEGRLVLRGPAAR